VAPGRHTEGVFAHAKGVVAAALEAQMAFAAVCVARGDVVLFDSYLPHRSAANGSAQGRRLAYLTFSPAAEVKL
jgi:ectoine hydroxylase-related dioxygenase (phytanoyl-CoA dioxygenase family)